MTLASRRAFKGDARHWPGLFTATAIFFGYVYLPILILIVLSFNENRTVTVWTGFSFDWYRVAFENRDILRAATNSLIIASVASVTATILATLAALRMASADKFTGKQAVNAAIALPITIPEIVPAVATLMFFASLGFTLGLGTVIIGHIVFCIPFAFLPIRARLEGMDPLLAEAAGDLYANPIQTFRRVTLPQLLPGILSGFVLAFIISLDDFVTTFFLGGAGSTTLPIYIFGLVRTGVTPEVNAISSLMLLLSLALVSLSLFLGRDQGRNAGLG
jgi:spermidine/putrescine transport system permease protein